MIDDSDCPLTQSLHATNMPPISSSCQPEPYYIMKILVGIITSLQSFKLVPFEYLGAVSYSPSIVTMDASLTVYEIFGVKP